MCVMFVLGLVSFCNTLSLWTGEEQDTSCALFFFFFFVQNVCSIISTPNPVERGHVVCGSVIQGPGLGKKTLGPLDRLHG